MKTSHPLHRYWNVANGSVQLGREPTMIRKYKGFTFKEGHVSLFIPGKGFIIRDHLKDHLTVFNTSEMNMIDAKNVSEFMFLEIQQKSKEMKTNVFTYNTITEEGFICVGHDLHLQIVTNDKFDREKCLFKHLHSGELFYKFVKYKDSFTLRAESGKRKCRALPKYFLTCLQFAHCIFSYADFLIIIS